jgi:GAF domain-containing protein
MSSAPTRRDIGQILAEYAQTMADRQAPGRILEQLAAYVTELLPVHGVGILLREGAGEDLDVATANTEVGQLVEELEVELREGPCTESMRNGEQILAPELAAVSDRYPRFAPRALDAGVKSIHALPMTLRGEQLGALDLIALEPMALDAMQLGTAQMLADVTVSYLANSRAFAETSRLAEQLQQALDSRVVIEQAKGMLAERHGVEVTEAFDRLRSHARSRGLRLRDVAIGLLRDEVRI